MKEREYRDYIQDILDAVESVEEFAEGKSFEDFRKDKKTIYAVTRCIEIVGEAAKKIPQSIRNKYPDIPWKDMAGMRDKLIHEYFGIDVLVLWTTAQKDMPNLKIPMAKIIEELNNY